MKILNVMLTTRAGGLEQSFLNYTESLTMQGNEVIPIIHSNSVISDRITQNHYKLWNFSKFDPVTLFRLKRIIKNENPDLIVTHGNRAHYLMKKAAGSITVIGVAHGPSFKHIVNCDYIITVNNNLKEELIQSGYGSDRIFYIPNIIKIPKNLSYKFSEFKNPPVIGLLGRLDSCKGIDVFVKSLECLRLSGVNFKAKIAGDGPEYQNIKNLINSCNLQQDIEILGWIEDKKEFFDSIDILCVTSYEESFGIVILEGFLHCKPVISSDATGPMEIVEHNKDALVFHKGDFAALAKLLEEVISNKRLAEGLTRNGFDKVKHYDIKNISKDMNDRFIKLSINC